MPPAPSMPPTSPMSLASLRLQVMLSVDAHGGSALPREALLRQMSEAASRSCSLGQYAANLVHFATQRQNFETELFIDEI
ncbi:unnamed protein product [Pieris macdunnoughi]|uniref:Uncharacterized protein n=1 Tax=Pieris macdunnoughi TaxID=345717 RepID=A0A821UL78_9NEOP|nr:unnamed protein product [Pieris macdunnoughi]